VEVFPDLDAVVPLERYRAAHPTDDHDIEELTGRALTFVQGFTWLREVKETYVGAIFPGIIGIFLLRIEPTREGVDEWTWVIVGDVPPAYITCEDAAVPWEALDGYIGALEPWIAAVRAGQAVDKLMPVNAPATEEYASQLETRLKFLDERIIPELGGPPPASAS
jgi:hypothetical protein